jgi:hypothetical protein
MTREELAAALRKADAAGNADDARRLAGAIRQLDAGPAAQAPARPAMDPLHMVKPSARAQVQANQPRRSLPMSPLGPGNERYAPPQPGPQGDPLAPANPQAAAANVDARQRARGLVPYTNASTGETYWRPDPAKQVADANAQFRAREAAKASAAQAQAEYEAFRNSRPEIVNQASDAIRGAFATTENAAFDVVDAGIDAVDPRRKASQFISQSVTPAAEQLGRSIGGFIEGPSGRFGGMASPAVGAITGGLSEFGATTARDPQQGLTEAVDMLEPTHMLARGGNTAVDAMGAAMGGDFRRSSELTQQALPDLIGGAGVLPAMSVTANALRTAARAPQRELAEQLARIQPLPATGRVPMSAPRAAAGAATQQAPTQPQTATAPPVPPTPPNAPAVTASAPQPVPARSRAEQRADDIFMKKMEADGVTVEDIRKVQARLARRGDSGVYETSGELAAMTDNSSGANLRGLQMAGGAAPGPLQEALIGVVNQNADKLSPRITRGATRATGQKADNAVATLDELETRLRTEAAPAYDNAYATPVDPQVFANELVPVLNTPSGQKAIQAARNNLASVAADLQARAARGADERSMMEWNRARDAVKSIDDFMADPVRGTAIPTTMALDYTKRAFDDVIADAGFGSDTARIVGGTKRNFADSVSQATGGQYGNALGVFEDVKRLEDAFEVGTKALNQKTWELRRDMSKGRNGSPWTAGEVEALAMGVARNIEDMIEANNQSALTKLLKDKALKNMATALGSQKAADTFEETIRRLGANREWGRRVAGGSDTAMRQAAIRDAGMEGEDAITRVLDRVETSGNQFSLPGLVNDVAVKPIARTAKDIYQRLRYPGVYDEEVNRALIPLIGKPMTEGNLNEVIRRVEARMAEKGLIPPAQPAAAVAPPPVPRRRPRGSGGNPPGTTSPASATGTGIVAGGVLGAMAPAEDENQQLMNALFGAGIGGLGGGVLGNRLARGSTPMTPPPASGALRPPPVRMGFGGKSLPMDEPSRMQRAREQGFDVDTPLYHGTASDFEAFDPSKFGNATGAQSAKLGVWLTGSPDTAAGYAKLAAEDTPVSKILKLAEDAERKGNFDEAALLQRAAEFKEMDITKNGGRGANVMPVYARGRFKAIDMEGAKYDPTDTPLTEIAKSAKAEGYDGIRLSNFSDEGGWGQYNPTEHVLVFDPKNIRGKFAKFDPSETQSSKLLAGVSGNPEAIGAGAGAVFAPDSDGDGEVSFGERAGAAITGGVMGRGARAIGNRLRGAPKPPPMRGPDQGSIAGRPKAPQGAKPAPGNKHGLEPSFREVAKLKGSTAIDKAARPPVTKAFTPGNADKQLSNIDRLLANHPAPEASSNAWSRMMADMVGDIDAPIPPHQFLKDMRNGGEGAVERLKKLTPEQIAEADHGFHQAEEFRQAYVNGDMRPTDTTKLFMWSFLSRGVSPYVQESMFLDAFRGADEWIEHAVNGTFDNAVLNGYKKWASEVSPAGSGLPGSGTQHNLNAFGEHFLRKMAQRADDGETYLKKLHDMIADPNLSGPEIRRAFSKFPEGIGIDNKVVSFTLLASGRKDVMVLDRIQVRALFNDGRFGSRNIYDPLKEDGAAVAGTALADITYGAHGIVLYEAIERALAKQVDAIYAAVGRPQDASIGRYHWDTWNAASGQEASHGTLGAILKGAKKNDSPLSGIRAKEGEYGAYSYNSEYGISADGERTFHYTTPKGSTYEFSVPAYREFIAEVKKPKNGVVPSNFKVTQSGNAPWTSRPEVNTDALDALAARYADRSTGERAGRRSGSQSAGGSALPGNGQSKVAGGPKRVGPPTTSVPVTRRPPEQAGMFGIGGGTRLSASSPKPQGVMGRSPTSGIGRTVAGGAIGAIAGGMAGEAVPQTPETAQKIADNDMLIERELGQIADFEGALKIFSDGTNKEIQAQLDSEGFDLGPTGIDGTLGDITKAAIRGRKDELNASLKTARERLATLEGERDKLKADAAFERTRPTDAQLAFRDYAPLLGGIAGATGAKLFRVGGTTVSKFTAKNAIKKADALLNNAPISPPKTVQDRAEIRKRATNVNEFWQRGGSKTKVPFETRRDGTWIARPLKDVMPPSGLFPDKFIGRKVGAMDALIGGSAVTEAVLAGQNAEMIKEKLNTAYENLKDDKSEENYARVQELEDQYAQAKGLMMLGIGAGIGTGIGVMTSKYASKRANVPKAEEELAILRDYFASQKKPPPKLSPRKKPTTPPPLPPSRPRRNQRPPKP